MRINEILFYSQLRRAVVRVPLQTEVFMTNTLQNYSAFRESLDLVYR